MIGIKVSSIDTVLQQRIGMRRLRRRRRGGRRRRRRRSRRRRGRGTEGNERY